MVVLSNAKPGREAEFNTWYDSHAADVLSRLSGFARAQRFELAPSQVEDGAQFQYLALYEVPEDQLETAQQAILGQRAERAEAIAAGREPVITVSDTLEGPHHTWFFTALGDEMLPDQD